MLSVFFFFFFFFNDTATTEIYTLSLHDALPIYLQDVLTLLAGLGAARVTIIGTSMGGLMARSEEHTSELQSLRHLVCRLLLEKKKKMSEFSIHSNIETSAYHNYGPVQHVAPSTA